jgi:conjugal transfer/entry exclusion protein
MYQTRQTLSVIDPANTALPVAIEAKLVQQIDEVLQV